MISEIWLAIARLSLPIHYGFSRWAIERWAHSLKDGMGYLVLMNIEFDENNLWFRGETRAAREERMLDEAYASLGIERPK